MTRDCFLYNFFQIFFIGIIRQYNIFFHCFQNRKKKKIARQLKILAMLYFHRFIIIFKLTCNSDSCD